jgi:hypothetical protein
MVRAIGSAETFNEKIKFIFTEVKMIKNRFICSYYLGLFSLITLLTGCNNQQISSNTVPPKTATTEPTTQPTPVTPTPSPRVTPSVPPFPDKNINKKTELIVNKKVTSINNKKLFFHRVYLGRENKDGSLSPVANGVFKRGENIYFVLMNVGKFAKDVEGINWIDIDLIVKNNRDKVIIAKESMLGERGRTILQDDIAVSPYGKINISPKLARSGKYKITIIIYDKISGAKLTQTKNLILK